MPVNLGLIGAGTVASLHAEGAAQAGVRIAAVCDVDRGRAGTLAARHDAASTTSVDALLERADVDAVIVALPNALHKPVAIAAMRAGKHVLLEKPMGLNAAECDDIVDAVRETGLVLQMGYVCRCAPAAEGALALVREGALGRVYAARASLLRRRGIPGLGRWFTTRAESGGGVLMDLGVHLVDLVLHLTGFPRPARASAVCTGTFGHPIDQYVYEEMWGGPPDPRGVFDVEDAATALVRFDDGMTMELGVSWAADLAEGRSGDGIVLLGDRGGCAIDLWANELILTTVRDGRLVDVRQTLPEVDAWTTAWRRQAETFGRNVSSNTTPEASAERGRAVQSLVDAFYLSAAEEREVEMEPSAGPAARKS